MSRSYDAVVIGLGALGSAAACRIAMAPGGPRVLGVEQFELNHDRGASQDVSRITRVSYHRREYVELAIEAQAAWRDIEDAARTQVITYTGGLDLGPPDAPEDIDDYAAAMTAAGVTFEWLDEVAIRRRWPVWRLPSGTRGIFQERGGIADPERGNPAHQRLAVDAGAQLRDRTRVGAIRDHGGELEIVLEGGETLTAGSVVVAADAWTNDLVAPLGYEVPLSVTREQVTWYEAKDPAAFAPDRFPIWIWLGAPSFYGFPTYRGPGPKIGEDIGGRPTTARTRSFDPDLDCLDRTGTFMAGHLPGAIGPALQTKTCLYTLTPDRDFVLDRVPGHPGVIVALGAAHAYKFAALFGRELAALALDSERRAPRPELAMFSLDRPGLAAGRTTNLVESA